MSIRTEEILDDDEFMKSVTKRRDLVEKITLLASVVFLLNTLITFLILKYGLTNTKDYGYKTFAALYGENIVVAAGIVCVFNKFKF